MFELGFVKQKDTKTKKLQKNVTKNTIQKILLKILHLLQ